MLVSDHTPQATDPKVIVIGGGPAGMMAAGQAALSGAQVILLEKMRQTGRKLDITGKGRCNLTNNASLDDFINAFGSKGRFLRQALMAFSNADLVSFIRDLGVPIELERGGRYFPRENLAPDITKALHQWITKAGVEIRLNSKVNSLIVEGGRITGVKAGLLGRKYQAQAVVLATGGLSYPATGSTGDGYEMAKAVGHTLVPTRPALVPIETSGDLVRRLQGLSLKNVSVRLMIDDKKVHEILGEMLFTHFGLSGPIILQMSQRIVEALDEKKVVELAIDLKPGLDERALEARLLRDFTDQSNKQLSTIFKGLLPASLIPVCLDLLDLPADLTGNQVTTAERRRLRQWLKDFRIQASGYRSYNEAIVTAGGVSLKEINPRTMESLITPGLYCAGELLDIDGPTGGYNLQAAFSTGWLAGRAAAGSTD